jgi:hypothetical protein
MGIGDEDMACPAVYSQEFIFLIILMMRWVATHPSPTSIVVKGSVDYSHDGMGAGNPEVLGTLWICGT